MFKPERKSKVQKVSQNNTQNMTIGDQLSIIATNLTRELNHSYALLQRSVSANGVRAGKVRHSSGNIVENATKRLLINCSRVAGLQPKEFEVLKGDLSDNGIEVTNSGGSVNVGVDWHLYIKGELKLAVECKSYLDSRFLKSTNADFEALGEATNATHMLVVMEKALNTNTLNYYLAKGDIDNCTFLMEGQRQSNKPIWQREYGKEVQFDKVFDLVMYTYSVIKSKI